MKKFANRHVTSRAEPHPKQQSPKCTQHQQYTNNNHNLPSKLSWKDSVNARHLPTFSSPSIMATTPPDLVTPHTSQHTSEDDPSHSRTRNNNKQTCVSIRLVQKVQDKDTYAATIKSWSEEKNCKTQ